ncbi:MAG: DUF2835 domain-containing protein [Shewanella sp.]|nr:DUF2835 domain-containing protein [Shewanella sp.]MCF1430429.1 DUF2835 domain-containing protein [Shewanella sp.]MCF1437322.1 DUF2835 domain-containing protein [Shewanella sp.]MCF1456937.1 DUF2835 domain-containing protein [Shewanella sp.]
MEYTFSLHLSYREFLPYYQGVVDKVEVHAHSGQRLWVHCRHFRPFFTSAGIHGHFRLKLDAGGKLVSLERV